MRVLGIESSCDETGLAIYDKEDGLLSHALYSQVALHADYGGVVPELASRDHIRRVTPLTEQVLKEAGCSLQDIDAVAYTQGPGLSGALLVGTSFAAALAMGLGVPTLPVHHLEGHLLAPLLEDNPPDFPFVALLVSGGHTQLMRVDGVGNYELLGDTLDDAAGEAFDKTAKLLGLDYPGGPLLAKLATQATVKQVDSKYQLPQPMLHSGDLNFSFSGLKTAVLTMVNKQQDLTDAHKANIAWAFQAAVTNVLTQKSMRALKQTGLNSLIVSGGVGANQALREQLTQAAKKHQFEVRYPRLEFCTDNGAMIAFAGALRLKAMQTKPEASYAFSVQPRWPLDQLQQPL